MNKTPIALALATAVAVAGFGALAAQDLQQHDQAVLTRWAELHAAEQAQFAEVPAVLALADTPLIDDAQRFDRYKQARAECTGRLFRLLAALRGDPLLAADGHVQALGLSLTQGQTSVDGARARYREALAAYNQGVNGLPRGMAAALLGYQERPDFVRHADTGH
jgi:hypothetical protein